MPADHLVFLLYLSILGSTHVTLHCLLMAYAVGEHVAHRVPAWEPQARVHTAHSPNTALLCLCGSMTHDCPCDGTFFPESSGSVADHLMMAAAWGLLGFPTRWLCNSWHLLFHGLLLSAVLVLYSPPCPALPPIFFFGQT